MIRKIISIKNVGRFENCAWRGGAQFESMGLIYAENGRGKSTFCDVLRSLQTGSGDIILGRKRLGATGDSEVAILADGNAKLTFKAGSWDSKKPEIAIFDSRFVHENVYAGDSIDHDHKKNLYRIIVGEAGVKLAEKVDALDIKARDSSKDAKNKLDLLTAKLPVGTNLKAFDKIAADQTIKQKIATKEDELKNAELAAKRSSEIKTKGQLVELTLPTFPNNFETLLAEKLPALAEQAEKSLREHLANHTHNATETWLSEGLAYQKDESCPFCGQSTTNLPLISAYQAYFDAAYQTLKDKLSDTQKSVEANFGEKIALAAQKTLGDNSTLGEFWRQLGPGAQVAIPDLGSYAAILSELRNRSVELLRLKIAAPLEATPLSQEYKNALASFEKLETDRKSYNSALKEFNKAIADYKAKQGAVDLSKLKSELAELKLIELRHTPPIIDAINAWKAAEKEKTRLNDEKSTAKTDLDTHGATVLSVHEKRINDLLKMFAAGFRISGTERSYAGGKPSSSYKLQINNVDVELGDENTPKSSPSFGNTLSAGDRSTLALALFIAQLERDPNLKDKIVVFDDPFTSQDRSRRTATQTLICTLAKQVRQVLVLSHDPHFLRTVWDSYKGGAGAKCFQFTRMANGTSVSEWEIEQETAGEYVKKHRVLWDYRYNSSVSTASAREVAQTIRPVLEEYLKLKLPHCFGDNEWLGDFIGKIRAAANTDPLDAAKVVLPKIEQINEYSKRYHHRSNPSADTELVDDAELLTFVELTLEVVGGF
jgi:wobble nucleotide-excising tRNase